MKKNESVVIFKNEDTKLLKIKIKKLEIEIFEVTQTYNEIEKEINSFQTLQYKYVGNILLKILNLKKAIAKKRAESLTYKDIGWEKANESYNNIKKEYSKFKGEYSKQKLKVDYNLNIEEKKRLKELFRKASFLCHPDKITDEMKSFATDIFNNLRSAYEKDDLSAVEKIYNDLKSGKIKLIEIGKEDEFEVLKEIYNSLMKKLASWKNKLRILKLSSDYVRIISNQNLESYFERLEESLKSELSNLEKEWQEINP